MIGYLWVNYSGKIVALPTALFGLGVMTFNIGQVETLQRTENRVNRMILRAARYAPNTTVRGEIGSSTMDSRIIESKFLLIKSIINGDNELVKEVLIRTLKEDNNIWNTKLRSQLGKVNMTEEDLWNMSKENIRRRIREVDKANWVKEMEKIKTLNVYRKFKKEIKNDNIYDNRESSKYLFKARSNTLEVHQRAYFILKGRNKSKICKLCKKEEESLGHFLLNCEILNKERDSIFISRYRGISDDETLGGLLFRTEEKDLETLKNMISRMWGTRKVKLKRLGFEQ